MTVRFPYRFVEHTDLGDVYTPTVPIKVFDLVNRAQLDVLMLVDTGSDYTILPHFVATYFGLVFDRDCVKTEANGVAGSEEIYFLKRPLKFKIGSITVEAPTAFFNHNRNPGLLGRLGFMDQFKVTFHNRKVEFTL